MGCIGNQQIIKLRSIVPICFLTKRRKRLEVLLVAVCCFLFLLYYNLRDETVNNGGVVVKFGQISGKRHFGLKYYE